MSTSVLTSTINTEVNNIYYLGYHVYTQKSSLVILVGKFIINCYISALLK